MCVLSNYCLCKVIQMLRYNWSLLFEWYFIIFSIIPLHIHHLLQFNPDCWTLFETYTMTFLSLTWSKSNIFIDIFFIINTKCVTCKIFLLGSNWHTTWILKDFLCNIEIVYFHEYSRLLVIHVNNILSFTVISAYLLLNFLNK